MDIKKNGDIILFHKLSPKYELKIQKFNYYDVGGMENISINDNIFTIPLNVKERLELEFPTNADALRFEKAFSHIRLSFIKKTDPFDAK